MEPSIEQGLLVDSRSEQLGKDETSIDCIYVYSSIHSSKKTTYFYGYSPFRLLIDTISNLPHFPKNINNFLIISGIFIFAKVQILWTLYLNKMSVDRE